MLSGKSAELGMKLGVSFEKLEMRQIFGAPHPFPFFVAFGVVCGFVTFLGAFLIFWVWYVDFHFFSFDFFLFLSNRFVFFGKFFSFPLLSVLQMTR